MTHRRSSERLKFLRIDMRAYFARKQLARVACFLAGIWLFHNFLLSDQSLIRYFMLRSDNDRIRVEIAETRETLDSLKALTVDLERNPAVIERVAREKYRMLRDDETAYVFLPVNESERETLLQEAVAAREREILQEPPKEKNTR